MKANKTMIEKALKLNYYKKITKWESIQIMIQKYILFALVIESLGKAKNMILVDAAQNQSFCAAASRLQI